MTQTEYIEQAERHFKKLLQEQLERAKRIENQAKLTDFRSKEKITIGFCGGDGIGPIIMDATKRMLMVLLKDEIASGKIAFKEIEGLTIENRIAKGESVPSDVLNSIKECDVFLKGPTTTPDVNYKGKNIESANVTLRRELDLFANVRPVKIPEKNIDWIFYRENTEGEYTLGSKGIEIGDTMAMDFKVTTEAGTKRIARAAFDYARNNGKKQVTIVTKANILKKTDGKFSRLCHEVAKDYPEINVDDRYIDIMCANLLDENIRDSFEVFVLPNLYGDIITDEAAQIQGGVGTAGSANIGSKYAMFEAIHGSAPRLIAEGLGEYASPASLMRAAEMMIRHIGFTEYANKLNNALDNAKTIVDGTKAHSTATAFTDEIIELLK